MEPVAEAGKASPMGSPFPPHGARHASAGGVPKRPAMPAAAREAFAGSDRRFRRGAAPHRRLSGAVRRTKAVRHLHALARQFRRRRTGWAPRRPPVPPAGASAPRPAGHSNNAARAVPASRAGGASRIEHRFLAVLRVGDVAHLQPNASLPLHQVRRSPGAFVVLGAADGYMAWRADSGRRLRAALRAVRAGDRAGADRREGEARPRRRDRLPALTVVAALDDCGLGMASMFRATRRPTSPG